MNERTNPISPTGYRRLREEYDILYGGERPRLLETIAWAAANGDRSENADYQYGRRRLREIDRRINFLAKRMAQSRIVAATENADASQVRFGACVTLEDGDGGRRVLQLVGDDEADAGAGRIGWNSPFARAMRGARIGDVRAVSLPTGERDYKVIALAYSDEAGVVPPETGDATG